MIGRDLVMTNHPKAGGFICVIYVLTVCRISIVFFYKMSYNDF